MEILFYCAKVTGISAVLFLYYRLFLREKTFHRFNRFYLLGTVLVSVALPWLKTKSFTVEVDESIYGVVQSVQQVQSATDNGTMPYVGILATVWAGVAAFFLGRFFMGILKINRLKRQFPAEIREGIRFYPTDLENAPFSYFRNLFWKNSINVDSETGRQVLKHELVHIEQRHTCDKIFAELVKCFLWFNPFFYLIKKELYLIHEYLADKEAVNGTDTAVFARMLLESHFPEHNLNVASPLFSADLKKRLRMLKKTKTRFGYIRRVLVLPAVFAVVFAFVVNAQNRQADTVKVRPAVKAENAAVPDKRIPKPEIKLAFTGEVSRSITEHPDLPHVLEVEEAAAVAREQSARRADEAALILAEADSVRTEAAVVRAEAEIIRREAALVRAEAKIIRRKADLIRQEAAVIRERSSYNKRTAL